VLVLDAIAGRVEADAIRNSGAYDIASQAWKLRRRRRGGGTPMLELPLIERYAAFVQYRASVWLNARLDEYREFRVRVVAPPALRATTRPGDVWSSRPNPGMTGWRRRDVLTVHVPLDWHISIERARAALLQKTFVISARTDRRGQMLQILTHGGEKLYYLGSIAGATPYRPFRSAIPLAPSRWFRARQEYRIG
jgi:hypothetical protein